MVEVRISPRRIRNQSKKSCGYGHFFSPLLAPQATHSKILAPGGANTAMAYQKTNSFFPRPPIPSGERTSPPLDHSPPLVSKRADLRIYFVMLTCPTHRYTQTPTKITSTRPQLSEIHHLKDHHRLDSTGSRCYNIQPVSDMYRPPQIVYGLYTESVQKQPVHQQNHEPYFDARMIMSPWSYLKEYVVP